MTTEFQAQLDGESVHCYGSIGNARGSLAETKPQPADRDNRSL
jgi:hypothetical protein